MSDFSQFFNMLKYAPSKLTSRFTNTQECDLAFGANSYFMKINIYKKFE